MGVMVMKGSDLSREEYLREILARADHFASNLDDDGISALHTADGGCPDASRGHLLHYSVDGARHRSNENRSPVTLKAAARNNEARLKASFSKENKHRHLEARYRRRL